MVGVVGSSPIAPTKQNPLCWAVWKGSPKGEPFFVVCDLRNACYRSFPLRSDQHSIHYCLRQNDQAPFWCVLLPFRCGKHLNIQRFTAVFLQPVIEKALLHVGNLSNIRSAFTTTVYAFLNPKLPSAAWDFFCLRFGVLAPIPPSPPSEARFFRLLLTGRFSTLYKGVRRC